jgi:hypothetical protein
MTISRNGQLFINDLGPPADRSGEKISGLHLSVADAVRGECSIGVD